MPTIWPRSFSQRRRSALTGSLILALVVYCAYYNTILQIQEYHQATAPLNDVEEIEGDGLPSQYSAIPEEPPFCAERFGTTYLRNIRDSATQYCNGSFEPSTGDFHLECNLGPPKDSDLETAFPDPHEFHRYWYGTGPAQLFKGWVRMDNETHEPLKQTQNYTILIKREGAHNYWHSLMEIYSMMLSLDALQMTSKSENHSAPYITERDAANTQIVILDSHDDGPYFDLRSLFATQPIRRIKDMPQNTTFENIIIPLPGASNTLWQGDWEVNSCESSTLLNVFADRVLELYGLNNAIPRQKDEIVVTFIDRVGGRQLVSQAGYLKQLQETFPQVKIQSIDFASMPHRDKFKIIQETDVLAGVHGAGLTHGIFLPPGSVMVEILPPGLNHKAFRNIAALRGHSYFSTHASDPSAGEKGDWHSEDVYIENERFMDVMDLAIKTMYNKGLRSHDVN